MSSSPWALRSTNANEPAVPVGRFIASPLAGLALEAGVGFDDELGPGGRQALGKRVPVGGLQDRAEVADRHVVAVDGAGRLMPDLLGRQVRDDLVAVEIEVDPDVAGAAFGATEQGAVKGAGLGQVADGKGEVESGNVHGGLIARRERRVSAFFGVHEPQERVWSCEARGAGAPSWNHGKHGRHGRALALSVGYPCFP